MLRSARNCFCPHRDFWSQVREMTSLSDRMDVLGEDNESSLELKTEKAGEGSLEVSRSEIMSTNKNCSSSYINIIYVNKLSQ